MTKVFLVEDDQEIFSLAHKEVNNNIVLSANHRHLPLIGENRITVNKLVQRISRDHLYGVARTTAHPAR